MPLGIWESERFISDFKAIRLIPKELEVCRMEPWVTKQFKEKERKQYRELR